MRGAYERSVCGSLPGAAADTGAGGVGVPDQSSQVRWILILVHYPDPAVRLLLEESENDLADLVCFANEEKTMATLESSNDINIKYNE